MKAAIFCEESQAITIEMRKRGIECYSVDLQDCSGGHPEWHIKTDVREMIGEYFDLIVFHPTCRYLTNSGVRWLHTEAGRWDKLRQGIEFFNLRHKFNCPHIATENPIPHKYAITGRDSFGTWFIDGIKMYDQIIQPWQFGDKKMKATCFWLKGLPQLQPTIIVGPPPKDKEERKSWQEVWLMPPSRERERERSKTYPGIAAAIAEQWGGYVLNLENDKSKVA